MLVFSPREAPVHPMLLDDLVAARVAELHRQARRERLATAGEGRGRSGQGVA